MTNKYWGNFRRCALCRKLVFVEHRGLGSGRVHVNYDQEIAEYEQGSRCECPNPDPREIPRRQTQWETPTKQRRPAKSANVAAEIEKLAVLLNAGVLTRTQFDAAVNRLLDL
jgi:hypothetical protein